MRKVFKRITVTLLLLALCLSMLPIMATKVRAADPITSMISYAKNRLGKSGQELGYSDQWCAFFVSDCAAYAGQSKAVPYHGYVPTLYKLVKDAGGNVVSTPQAGDLVFYNCTACDTDGDGLSLWHVGLMENENYSIEGNLDGSSYLTRTVKRKGVNERYSHGSGHNTDNYIKRIFVRPNYTSTVAPEKPHISTSKPYYAAGSSITISWNSVPGNAYYWINLYRNGELIVNESMDQKTSYTYENAAAGEYSFAVSANNSAGTSGGTGYSFLVGQKPNMPEIANNTQQYEQGETLVIQWNAVVGSEFYWINVYKDDVLIVDQSTETQVSYTLSKMNKGVYTVFVSANNSAGTSGSDSYQFVVGEIETIISYDANGGTGAPDGQIKYYGTTLTLSTTKPTRTGYTFLGWATSSTATSATYQPGGSFDLNENTTLYAVWKKVFYGDVNEDGQIDFQDISRLNKIRLGQIDATDWEVFLGDLDGDGEITFDDEELLNQFRLNKLTEFPVEQLRRQLVIDGQPPRQFCLGSQMNTNGLTVFLYYPDTSSAHDITDHCIIQLPSTGSTGSKTVSISFEGLKADYTVQVTGHNYSYKVTKAPTTTATGTLTGTCTYCAATTTVTMPQLAKPEYNYKLIQETTCTTNGTGRYTWNNTTYGTYGSFCFDVVIPAYGHYYVDGKCTGCDEIDPNYKPNANAPRIILESKAGVAGATVSMVVKITGNTGFNALNLALVYDKNVLSLESAENLATELTMTSGTAYVWDCAGNYAKDGDLLKLTFRIADNAVEGDYTVQVAFMGASNEAFEEVQMVTENGKVTVTRTVYGDANGDGKVTTVDLSMLRKYLANLDPVTGESAVAAKLGADANGDGKISTVDLSMMRKYFANLDPTTGQSSVVLGPK